MSHLGIRTAVRTAVLACVTFGLLVLSVVGVSQAATWTIQTTPNAAGSEHSTLFDITCASTTTEECLSVGQKRSGSESQPYGQFWNGSSWSNIEVPDPAGATQAELQSTDCSNFSCSAAGSYSNEKGTFPLVERWEGAWALQEAVVPEGASVSAFKGISCSITCIAVGRSVVAGKTKPLIELWSLINWSIQSAPSPEGAESSELHGVDCAKSGSCVAVGSYVDKGVTWAWTATLGGGTWTLRTVPKPTGAKESTLLDVSCAETTSCVAVGGYRNSESKQVTFVVRWNGTAWTHQASPNPAGSNNTVFQNVHCITGAPCVAVGDWRNSSNVWQPMAQAWNGSAWVLDTTPTPSGATFSLLEGVACAGTQCLATGWYTNSEGKNRTLGEKR